MCGICGILSAEHDKTIDPELLERMARAIEHRGPDDSGTYRSNNVGLSSLRLSIQDLSSSGHMPMCTPDQRYWIVYNGEVYNFNELRSVLKTQGYSFRSNSDTEVVLALYAAKGPLMLDLLNGMFAIAIWDSVEETLFLARDRMGIKPLFYAQFRDLFVFASEEKAIFETGFPKEFDQDCWEELLLFRYVSGENTPFQGVKKLLPGHYLTWHDGQFAIHRWWNLAKRAMESRENIPADSEEWFQQAFDQSISYRRISDVPIGVLLSGGIDSCSVAAAAALQAGPGVASFTMRFTENEYDEGPLASQIVQRYALVGHDLCFSNADVVEQLRKAVRINDEPLAHGNEPHILAISEYAKPLVTVLLSGEGADETLGGYVRYLPLLYPHLLKNEMTSFLFKFGLVNLNNRFLKLGRFLSMGSINDFILFNACDTLPQDLMMIGMEPKLNFPYRREILKEAEELFPTEPVRQGMYLDQHTFLPSVLDRNDRMTMGASIECRVPFLDYRLVEMEAALPTHLLFRYNQGKKILRKSMENRLPKQILHGRKWGFGVPWTHYFRDFPEFVTIINHLAEQDPFINGPFKREMLHDLCRNFLNGDNRYNSLIRQFVMIAVWWQELFQ